jgi:SAM-dependent methyltransferase/uncharacterized protein YbaR (Trm112 family)
MKQWLLQMLICPNCLTEEVPLKPDNQVTRDGEILEGVLSCPACNTHYPIQNGVAAVLPDQTAPMLTDKTGYNSRSMLSAYLWSHYGDLFQDPDATEAYRVWSSFFRKTEGPALDIGCSVGRLSFELSKTHSRVIGIDTSISFIEKARELMSEKKLTFDLIIEGLITEKRSCDFHPAWNYDRIDFIVADALALPFRKQAFATVTSINILEKVSRPLTHLMDVNRVMRKSKSMFVFSDPFSWDETFSDPRHWLGGVVNGNARYRGMDRVIRYFWGKDNIFDPPLEITDKGDVNWKIRKTENLWEHIRSQYAVGIRR